MRCPFSCLSLGVNIVTKEMGYNGTGFPVIPGGTFHAVCLQMPVSFLNTPDIQRDLHFNILICAYQNKNKMESSHVLDPSQEHENLGSNGELPMNPGEYNEARMILNDPLHQSMTTSVSFDTHEQLFWAGTHSVSQFSSSFSSS